MLSAVNDYKFVEPQNIVIDGGLMPLRQGDAKKVLRGEDAAFLREAACRISYLAFNQSDTSFSEDFTVNAGPRCGGVCNQYILGQPLTAANDEMTRELKFYSSRMIGSQESFVWDTSAFPNLNETLPEVLSAQISPNPIPDHTASFAVGKPFLKAPIEELVDCVSAFTYPTRRGSTAQSATSTTSTYGDWTFNWSGRRWLDYSGPYGGDAPGQTKFPNGRADKFNLEGIYSNAIYYGPSSTFTGWATAGWNPNTSLTSHLMPLQWNGVQWTDRDGVVHQADPTISESIVHLDRDHSQALVQFHAYQEWIIVQNGNPVPSKSGKIDKTVILPVEFDTSWQDGLYLDRTSVNGSVDRVMQLAGLSYMNTSFLQSKGMGLTDAYAGSGGTMYVQVQAIHGIFTMNDDLKIQQS